MGVTATAVGPGRRSGVAAQLAVGATLDVTAAGRCAAVTTARPGPGAPSGGASLGASVGAGIVAWCESVAAAAAGP